MGNTNWLRECESSSDCGDQLACHCGICTRECTRSAECSDLKDGVCDSGSDALTAACGSAELNLCLPECSADRECGKGLRCVDTRCIPAAIATRTHTSMPGSGGVDATTPASGGCDAGPGPIIGCKVEGPNVVITSNGHGCDDAGDCWDAGPSCDGGVCGQEVDAVTACQGGACVDASALRPMFTGDCSGALAFPDRAFEVLVRMTINKAHGDIQAADVESLTSLSNDSAVAGFNTDLGGDIASLSGIECLRSLTHVDFDYGTIDDTTPLASLPKLTFIQLNHQKLTDVTLIGQLTKLTGLYLSANLIEDVTPLANLDAAIEISLENNRVRDATALQDMKSLGRLWLTGNPLDCAANASAFTAMQDRGVAIDAPQCP